MWKYETTPVFSKGLDYVVQRGVQAIEAEYEQRIGELMKVIHQMGRAVQRKSPEEALALYDEFCREA